MTIKLFKLEKAPFLAIALFFLGLALRYFEDLRKAPHKSEDYYHAFSLFVVFLFTGTLSIGLYIGFTIAEKNISRNMEKSKEEGANPPSQG